MVNHHKICVEYTKLELISEHETELAGLRAIIDALEKENEELKRNKSNIPINNNFNFNINAEFLKQDDSNNSDEEKEEKYVLKDLEITNGYTINHREEDGYINVTNRYISQTTLNNAAYL